MRSAEEFLCALYSPKKWFAKADDVRYFLFCQKNNKSEELPPTSDSLGHHIKQANYQTYVRRKALVPLQTLPSPDGNGWKLKVDRLVPVLISIESMSKSIIELTTCRCSKSTFTQNCSCKVNNLSCTEACTCMADEDCQNMQNEQVTSIFEDSSDSECEQWTEFVHCAKFVSSKISILYMDHRNQSATWMDRIILEKFHSLRKRSIKWSVISFCQNVFHFMNIEKA